MDTFITTSFNDVALIASLIMCGIGMFIIIISAGFFFTIQDGLGTKKNLLKMVMKVGAMITMLSILGIIAAIILK